MSTADLAAAIRARLDAIAGAALVAAEAIDSNPALDLPEGTLTGLLADVETLGEGLTLMLHRRPGDLDPAALAGYR
jgi:hypothetical protein